MTRLRVYAALAGVAAAAVALGLGELVAMLIAPRSSPLVAVGGVVIDAVPEWGKELAIRLFGTNDKLALQAGTVIILAAIAAGVGVLSLRWLWVGPGAIAVFGAVGVAAALTRTGASAVWAVASLLGAAAAAPTLWYTIRRLAGNRDAIVDASNPQAGTERRRFLQIAAAIIGGAAVAGFYGRWLGQQGTVEEARSAVRLPTPSGAVVAAPPGADVAGLSYVTPNGIFYRIDTALVVPQVDPVDWSLQIHGRVRTPMRLSFDDLLRRPMIERFITLTCVSNDVGGNLIGNARWLGVPVRDLLEEAGPEEGADQVVSRSVDGFTAGTPTTVLRDGRDAMLAIAMNGEPLPTEHGFPVRMVVPGLYGYVSATKWLAELEVTSFDAFDAYWIPRGWAQQAPVKTQSRIDRPRAGATVPPGQVVVAGVAWAQHRGIERVEVRVDQGQWREATLAATASVDTWRLWSWNWSATPGQHVLEVRATDATGEIQTGELAPPAPDGATGWHMIGVDVA